MKTQNLLTNSTSIVKRFMYASVVLLMLSACSNDDETAEEAEVTEEMAVEAITLSVESSSGGVTEDIEEAAKESTSGSLSCNETVSGSYSNANGEGSTITYSINYSWEGSLSCTTAGVPQNFTYDYNGNVSYDAPRMSSNDTASGELIVTGLAPSSTLLTVSALISRQGSQESKIGNMLTYSSVFEISSTNIVVDKATDKITGGTAQVSFVANVSNGNKYEYGGLLTFNGDDTATLQLNNGNTYTLNL